MLIESGYPVDVAEKLARSGCDLHRAVELAHACADPELAAKILL